MTKRIKENPSIKPLVELLQVGKLTFDVLDRVPFIYKLSPKLKSIKDQYLNIEKMSNILDLPDQFNDLYSKYGWICYGGLSKVILENSVKLGLEDKIEEGQKLLINSFDKQSLNLILLQCRTREHFKTRVDLLELIKIDYLEERYHAAIPLLLALIDGLADDVSKHIGFFTEGLDLELPDSMTAHKTGLPFLKTIMNSPRKNTTNEKISIPYRNGILHGRDLNFNNKEVASKCWWALASLIEWSDEKKLDKKNQENYPFMETLRKHSEKLNYSKRIEDWQKRPSKNKEFWRVQQLNTLEENTPEYALLKFLEDWKNGRWKNVSEALIQGIGKHLGTFIKEVKSDYSQFKDIDFYLISSEDQYPSSSKIRIFFKYTKHNNKNSTELDVYLRYSDKNLGKSMLRNEPNGQWFIIQNSFLEILFK